MVSTTFVPASENHDRDQSRFSTLTRMGRLAEAAPTVENDLNTDQHVESSAVNGSNATQGGDSEERRAPRRTSFSKTS